MKCGEVHLYILPGEVEPWFEWHCPFCSFEQRYPLRNLLLMLTERDKHYGQCIRPRMEAMVHDLDRDAATDRA